MDRYENTMQNRKVSGFRLLLMAAVVAVIMLGAAGVVYAEESFTISSPDDNAKVELGKSVAIKGHASYTTPSGSNVFNKKPNYIYVRVTKEGEQETCFDNFDSPYSYTSSFSIFSGNYDISFKPSEEGQYLIEVCRDLTYENGEHVAMTNDRFEAQKSRTIIVQRKLDGDNGAQVTIPDQIYTGDALTPAPTVTLDAGTEGAKVLDPETDYDVTYKNNIDVGISTMTITGKGFYKNKVSRDFQISPADIGDVAVSGIENRVYSGETQLQSPEITYLGKKLTEGEDYVLSYQNNLNAGQATVTITGSGNFCGSRDESFSISRVSLRNVIIADVNANQEKYTGSPITKDLFLVYADRKLQDGTDYDAVYANNIGPGTATVTITGKGNFTDTLFRTFSIIESAASSSAYSWVEDPSDKATFNVGDSITVTAKTRIYQYLNYKGSSMDAGNFIYVRVIRDGQNVHYKKYKYKSSQNSIVTDPITLSTAGEYQIQTCWQKFVIKEEINNGNGNFTLVPEEIAYEDFVPDSSIKVYVGMPAPDGAEDISSATVTGITAKTYTGDSITQSMTVNLGSKTLNYGTDYYTIYTNNQKAGTATVAIRGKGNYKGALLKFFQINKKPLSNSMLKVEPSEFAYSGSVQKPAVTVKDGNYFLKLDKDLESIVIPDSVERGKYTVTATAKEDGNYSGTASGTYTIGQSSIKNAKVVLSETGFVYDGQDKCPQVTAVNLDGALVPAEAYSVEYRDNRDAGTGTVVVSAKNDSDYSDSAEATFTIAKRKIEAANATLSPIGPVVYDGKEQKPAPTVTVAGHELKSGTDYKLSYESNVDAGTGKVLVTGIGNYTGGTAGTFTIEAKDVEDASITIEKIPDQIHVTGTPATPAVVVKDGTKKLSSDDFDVAYTDNEAVGDATATITGKGNYKGQRSIGFRIIPSVAEARAELSALIEELETTLDSYLDSDKATVQNAIDTARQTCDDPQATLDQLMKAKETLAAVKAVADQNLDDAGAGKTLITGAKVNLAQGQFVYSGEPITPAVTSVVLDKQTIPADEYVVTYRDNLNAGIATVTVTAKAASSTYTGSVSATFTIGQRSLKQATIDLEGTEFYYVGAAIEPQVIQVTAQDDVAVPPEAYAVTYSNNINKGSATVNVTAKKDGNFKDSQSTGFTINPRSLEGASVVLTESSFIYSGAEIRPVVAAVTVGGATIPASDYTVDHYTDNRNAGEASVTVKPKTSNVTGTATGTFTIEKCSIEEASITLKQDTYDYTGNAIEPEVTSVKLDGTAVPADAYTISYKHNTNAGNATVIVEAKADGNYQDSANTTFTINRKSIAEAKVNLAEDSYVYDGTAKNPAVTSVILDGTTLPEDSYWVTYSDNVDAGTATATVTAREKSNFRGSATAGFSIARRSLEGAEVRLEETIFTYTGKPIEPKVTAVLLGSTLVPEDAYDVSYRDNDKIGTASAIVTAKAQSNYSDSSFAGFRIQGEVDHARQSLSYKVNELEDKLDKYLVADKEKLRVMIDEAKALVDDDAATLGELEKALSDLEQAKSSAETNLVKAEEQAKAEEEARRQEADPRSAASVEKKLLSQKSDSDPAGSSYAPLRLRSTKQSAKSNKLAWKRTSGAAEYVVYGNKCGKSNKLRKLATVKGTSFTHSKLVKGTYYKYVVVAVKNTGEIRQVTAISKMIHVGTAGGKAGNFKSVKVSGKVLKKAKKLKAGKKLKLKAKAVKSGKKASKHCGVRYESANTRIATVNRNGVVKGIRKGTCTVYAYTQNGVCKTIKVKVI